MYSRGEVVEDRLKLQQVCDVLGVWFKVDAED
jgi:hypothetical protein